MTTNAPDNCKCGFTEAAARCREKFDTPICDNPNYEPEGTCILCLHERECHTPHEVANEQ